MFLSQDYLDPSKLKSPLGNKKVLHDPTAERRKSHVFNETLLDKELSHWSECKITGKKVQRRSYHSCVCYDKKLYIYGGYEVNQGILQDFIEIDLDERLPSFQWEDVRVKSKINPGPLCRHSTVIYKDKMYIYGGQVSSLRNTSQFMSYSFTTKEWSRVVPSNVESLPPIDSHVATLWEKDGQNASMIVVGGFIGGRLGQYSNAVYEYSFTDNQWTVLSKNKHIEAGSPQNSSYPQGRMSLGATVNKNDLYIFGGNEGNTKFSDLWKFGLLAKKWTQVKVEGTTIPEARSGITLTSHKHMLVLFGGILDITHEKNDIFVFNTNNGQWSVAEQATKWVFTQEENNKLPKIPVKKSAFSKSEVSSRVVSLSISPRKPSLSKSKYQNIKQIDSDFNSQISDQSQDMSMTDRPTDTKKKVRFAKLELPTIYNNGSPRMKPSKSGGLIGGHSLFKSSMEENHIKNRMLKKMILLNEFEVSEKEAAILRAVTPATEALIKSLQSLSSTPLATERMETTAAHFETSFRPGKKEEKIKPGVKPVARDGHSATIVDNKLYIFAGDRHRVAFNDLFTLDLGYFANL